MNILAHEAGSVIQCYGDGGRIGAWNSSRCEVGEVDIRTTCTIVATWSDSPADRVGIATYGRNRIGYCILFVIAKIEGIVLYLIASEELGVTGRRYTHDDRRVVSYSDNRRHEYAWSRRYEKYRGNESDDSNENSEELVHILCLEGNMDSSFVLLYKNTSMSFRVESRNPFKSNCLRQK